MQNIILLVIATSVLGTVHSLECYNCNSTNAVDKPDACKGLESLTKCTDPALCLSATVIIEDGPVKKYSSIKQCHIPQNGQECENFLKNLKNMYPSSKVELFNNQCKTCDKTGCNKSGASTTMPILFTLLVSYVLCKLM
ncbi:uncharacterized protein LOC126879056 isoform X2 [Diabrotica virgifera virgifera]|uniref:Uncharacterized protein LOC114330928 isoform X2 n=1 Tax=Diabrotica virgifera virgifera TaxID=50390 RepID=A0A6P7FTU7_DIAVI|nr:uncharacterized protein LOC126879056 isoform X2 [Diabrotica virgifera virgifera]